jgi:DNA-binding MarR family transcriptional regulator
MTLSTATAPPARAAAVRDAISALLEVRGWYRETHRWASPDRPAASLWALALVEAHGPARVGELAEHARLDVSVVSRQLQQLEREGLVERSRDPEDGRAHLVRLSDGGRAVLAEGRANLDAVATERLRGWDTQQLTTLAASLRQLLSDLHDPRGTRNP